MSDPDKVHLLFINDSLLGVYGDLAEACRIAALVRQGESLTWTLQPGTAIAWEGHTATGFLLATLRIDSRMVG